MAPEKQRALRSALASFPPAQVEYDVPLDRLSRWQIGGPAAAVVSPSSAEEAAAVLAALRQAELPVIVIGETSNMLFDSRGFDGVLVRVGPLMSSVSFDGTTVRAEAGVSVPDLVRRTAEAGLAGIIHAAGVPGTLGGLVVMNGGTQRKGVGEHVSAVTATDSAGGIHELRQSDLGFSYRQSALQGSDLAVLEVTLELEPGDAELLVAEIEEILVSRESKFPQHLPNCGSTFLSDPSMYPIVGPPGRAIEQAGLKGLSRGGAQISERHANFIINNGGATDADVLWLIAQARHTVRQATGFTMDCEVKHLSRDGALRPAHLVADHRWPEAKVEA